MAILRVFGVLFNYVVDFPPRMPKNGLFLARNPVFTPENRGGAIAIFVPEVVPHRVFLNKIVTVHSTYSVI